MEGEYREWVGDEMKGLIRLKYHKLCEDGQEQHNKHGTSETIKVFLV